MHYLPLLERKIGALDQTTPLEGWELPEEYATLRWRMEASMGAKGKREFVRVLRLMEDFSPEQVHHPESTRRRLGTLDLGLNAFQLNIA